MKKKIDFTIVVPFYNEEENLKKTYLELRKSFKNLKQKYEVIFVNDCSTDNSMKILKKINFKNKKIIINKKNLGYGASLKIGFVKSKGKYITFLPSDNEHPAIEIKKMYTKVIKNNKIDILVPYVINEKARSLIRRFLSNFYTRILNILFLENIPYFNGLIIYKRSILMKSINKIENPSFSFNAELLLRSLKYTQKIDIIPYKLRKKKVNLTTAFKLKNILLTLFYIGKYRFSNR